MLKIQNREFEEYLQTHGGNYTSGYGFESMFDNKQGWQNYLGVIKKSNKW